MPQHPIERDLRTIFRALSLRWIFVDQTPESSLNQFMPKNFGSVEAVQVLVFLSWLASGSVCGDVALESGMSLTCVRAFALDH